MDASDSVNVGELCVLERIEAGFAAVWDSRVNGFLPGGVSDTKAIGVGTYVAGSFSFLSPHSKGPLASFEWWIS